MAKDPAFLFYYQDFLVGTEFMEDSEVGCYIKILCHMADKGKLSEKHVLSICKASGFTDDLKNKFEVDSDGFYFNKRLLQEVTKRKNFTESRRTNALSGKKKGEACAEHMENENENINEDIYVKKSIVAKEIIDIFNKICSSRFRHTETNIKAINGRLNDGFTKDDCIAVIKKKYPQWKNDPKMSKYIRIETFFRPSKFESYLNEKVVEICKKCKGTGKFTSTTGFVINCDCKEI